MGDMLMVLFNVVFPVFAVILIGFLFGRFTDLDIKPSSKLALYIFTPALYFNSMLTAEVNNDEIVKILGYAALLFALFVAIVYLISTFVLKYPPQLRSALFLSTAFPNSGNYGLPIILFAFQQAGFERAIIFSVFQSFLMNSAGVYFASNSNNNFFASLKDVIKMPGFIALLVAMIMRFFSVDLPEAVLRPVQLMGQAAIPTLLVVLGIQLGRVKAAINWKFIGTAVFLRLFAYPLIGLSIIPLFFK
jgi:predicted permease